jgi:SAM-dependent methyltransferase
MRNDIGELEPIEKDVIRTISPNETMNRTDASFPEEYWVAGRSALQAIRSCLKAANKAPSDIHRVLDIPCGHGRILRYLKATFSKAEFTACDLLRDGVDFCSSVFGAIPVYSTEDLSMIPLKTNYFDLIWVGSLLTHLDSEHWGPVLNKLSSCLRDDGVLVFTAHGDYVYRSMKGLEEFESHGLPYWRITQVLYRFERTGFGYAPYLGSNRYGISVSAPHWVLSTISRHRELRCVHFTDRSWHGLQDVYGCVKVPSSKKSATFTPLITYLKHLAREVWRPMLLLP